MLNYLMLHENFGLGHEIKMDKKNLDI